MAELQAEQAGEGGSGQRAVQLGLGQQAGEQINVVRMLVDLLHSAKWRALILISLFKTI